MPQKREDKPQCTKRRKRTLRIQEKASYILYRMIAIMREQDVRVSMCLIKVELLTRYGIVKQLFKRKNIGEGTRDTMKTRRIQRRKGAK